MDQDHARFAKTMESTCGHPILWTRLAWRSWMADHGGAVINTASVGGIAVSPDLGIYHTSKAALIHLTKQLALELAPKVRVNAVAPGVVRTRLAEALWKEDEDRVAGVTPLGRIGEPADIGGAVAFLASDRARAGSPGDPGDRRRPAPRPPGSPTGKRSAWHEPTDQRVCVGLDPAAVEPNGFLPSGLARSRRCISRGSVAASRT